MTSEKPGEKNCISMNRTNNFKARIDQWGDRNETVNQISVNAAQKRNAGAGMTWWRMYFTGNCARD